MLRLIQSPTATGPQHAPAVIWGGLMGGPVLLRRRRQRLTQHSLLVPFPSSLPLICLNLNELKHRLRNLDEILGGKLQATAPL